MGYKTEPGVYAEIGEYGCHLDPNLDIYMMESNNGRTVVTLRRVKHGEINE